MTNPGRVARRAEAGRGVGCILSIMVTLVILCAVAFIGGRLVATPELGAAVSGPSHGDSPGAISSRFAALIAAQLLAQNHAVVILSEHDLTVFARDRNPDPEKFHNPEVRLRNSFILLSADTTIGPLKVVAVAHVTLLLTGVTDGSAHIATDITQLDVGRQSIPSFMRSSIDPRGNGALSLDPIFNDSPQLAKLRSSLECIFIGNDGVHLGFHRPGATPDPGSCNPTVTAPTA